MTESKRLAGLIGPVLIAVASSEAWNLHIWAINLPSVTYLDGTLLFIAGLAIVRVHNRWTLSWPVTITLIGWVTLIGGFYRMLRPEAKQPGPGTFTYGLLVALFVLGCFLTFQAARAPKTL